MKTPVHWGILEFYTTYDDRVKFSPVFQTLVPMLTMFTPVALLVILPMFSINVGTFANAPSLNAGIYPALDATIAIFMIRDFREAVTCRRGQKVAFSTTSGVAYSVSTDNGVFFF
ncbi:hypothetical protein GCK72_020499 [Caenorhabditis remanei]|uniref:Uncharacterized protein n=1 Tax=Caenorhabditis remanei TaxID=31234 RepID=A0A6A5GHF9_CAERE|nr:hypothetical protein GCK72_020499 [Caenorhabditis remanei]KAF1753942.1 hypothetical protein GCK72_020499 [Caenorhabditis remanei]